MKINNKGFSLISILVASVLISTLIVGVFKTMQVTHKSLKISKSQFQSIELSKRILYALQEQGGANGKNACTNTLKDITLNNHGQDIQTIKKATATHSDSPTVLFKKGDEVLPSQITIRELKAKGDSNHGYLEVYYTYTGFDISDPHYLGFKVVDTEGDKLKSCDFVSIGKKTGCTHSSMVIWGNNSVTGRCTANLATPMKHSELRRMNKTLVASSHGYYGTTLVQCLNGSLYTVKSICQHQQPPSLPPSKESKADRNDGGLI